jgi:hypothetical protein
MFDQADMSGADYDVRPGQVRSVGRAFGGVEFSSDREWVGLMVSNSSSTVEVTGRSPDSVTKFFSGTLADTFNLHFDTAQNSGSFGIYEIAGNNAPDIVNVTATTNPAAFTDFTITSTSLSWADHTVPPVSRASLIYPASTLVNLSSTGAASEFYFSGNPSSPSTTVGPLTCSAPPGRRTIGPCAAPPTARLAT